MTRPDHDVVIIGDGPAGAALAAACREIDLDVAVLGSGDPWTNTYGVWRDEVPDLPDDAFVGWCDRAIVRTGREHHIARAYGVLDTAKLRARLGVDDVLVRAKAETIVERDDCAVVRTAFDGDVAGGVVIDATGAGSTLVDPIRRDATGSDVWQTAFGVIVDDPSAFGYPNDAVTLMDWSAGGGLASFCYVVPTSDGWLIEETSLAARPAIGVDTLQVRLGERLGVDAMTRAGQDGLAEQVRIPMNTRVVSGAGPIGAFGAAAGYTHPATGYSVATALRMAPLVAAAIGEGRPLQAAIWPAGARRARALHDYGLSVLLRLDAADTITFFDAFFSLSVGEWAPYLRVDVGPTAIANVMRRVAGRVPWSVRRQLLVGDRRDLLRLVVG